MIRWQNLGLRERRLLLICGVLLLFAMFKYGLMMPMSYYQQQTERDYVQAKTDLDSVILLLDKIKLLQQKQPEKKSYPLEKSIEESLQQHQLQKIKWVILDNSITIESTEVEFAVLISWLADLEGKYGIYVNEIDFHKHNSIPNKIQLIKLRLQRNE